ncbi:transcriptional regulator [Trinickia terrae]|uniref:Transcriptional regulator n=1 Tax=Trinickia terrae TaxID=2571161 RepID=A0A4U1IFC0_9BURK|nr:putative glycolipid-binding domain-containing protein [Trinickia terrae]TKC92424.1 transcriptional regulator [Trinickia terrae]
MRELRWISEEGDGIEHLAFDVRDECVVAESALIGEREGHAYGLCYRIDCDAQGCARHAFVRVMGGQNLELHSDGAGHWRDGNGLALAHLDGCIDVDIAATPFTNTLPIRRLKLAQGERAQLDMAYISTPDLQVTRMRQAYICIEPDREYRYENVDSDFAANLKVDEDGLVIDYPTLFTRVRAAEDAQKI